MKNRHLSFHPRPTPDRPIKPYRPETCQQGSLCNPASEFRLEPFEIGRPLIPISPSLLPSLFLFFLHPFHGYVTTAWETNAIDKRGERERINRAVHFQLLRNHRCLRDWKNLRAHFETRYSPCDARSYCSLREL